MTFNIKVTLSAKSSLIQEENKAAFCREGHNVHGNSCMCNLKKLSRLIGLRSVTKAGSGHGFNFGHYDLLKFW